MDWNRVRELAALGWYAADIARAVNWHSDASNLKRAAWVRGIHIPSMTTSERARRAGRIGGRKPKRRAALAAAPIAPPAAGNVLGAIRRLLGAA
jgi:hypothetical protein